MGRAEAAGERVAAVLRHDVHLDAARIPFGRHAARLDNDFLEGQLVEDEDGASLQALHQAIHDGSVVLEAAPVNAEKALARSSRPPTLCQTGLPIRAPGMKLASWLMRPEVGSASSVSRSSVVCWRTFEMSTTGDSPVTVMVSSTVPTLNSALIAAVNPVVSSTPSRLERTEARQAEGHRVNAGTQVDNPVQALAVSDDAADLVDEGRTGSFDGDAWQYGTRRIAHHSCNGGTIGHLRRCTGGTTTRDPATTTTTKSDAVREVPIDFPPIKARRSRYESVSRV